MSDSILKNGLELAFTTAAYHRLVQMMPRQVSCRKNVYGLPKGFIPGKDEDLGQAYGEGSKILTKEGNLFLCADATVGKAVWVQIKTQVTENSYEEPEPVEEVEEVEEVPETEIPEDKRGVAGEEETVVDPTTPLKELTEIPYLSYLTENNEMKTIQELIDAIDSGELESLKYLNKKRATAIVNYLTGEEFYKKK